jgi:hypothetical protein
MDEYTRETDYGGTLRLLHAFKSSVHLSRKGYPSHLGEMGIHPLLRYIKSL